MEIIIGILGLLFTFGLFGFAAVFSFKLAPALEAHNIKKRFPIELPPYGMRLNKLPGQITKDDIYSGLLAFKSLCKQYKNYTDEELKLALLSLHIEFISPDNQERKRYIVDSYDRKIAGDIQGDFIRVVYLETDKLGNTAFFHELGHACHAKIENRSDYEHTDEAMWIKVVGESKELLK